MITVHTMFMWYQPDLYDKCLAVIKSCKNKGQLEVAKRYIDLAKKELEDYNQVAIDVDYEDMVISLRAW